MTTPIRNRIKCHRRVRAGDLVPHEWNFRMHPDLQRSALAALYREVGFARSLLAYELPDGRLKLIDGHLRRDLDPELEVDVEVLDVNDAEARTLLLSIDPLATLAQTQAEIHERLLELTPAESSELAAAWQRTGDTGERGQTDWESNGVRLGDEQFMILIKCRNEPHQVELLTRLGKEGLECKALIS